MRKVRKGKGDGKVNEKGKEIGKERKRKEKG